MKTLKCFHVEIHKNPMTAIIIFILGYRIKLFQHNRVKENIKRIISIFKLK